MTEYFTFTTVEYKAGRMPTTTIYVTMPGQSEDSVGYDQSIWALPTKELTTEVKNAIKQAFKLGMEAQKTLVRQRLNAYTETEWEGLI